MNFLWKKQEKPQPYYTAYWDEGLYLALSKILRNSATNMYYFECLLSKRTSRIGENGFFQTSHELEGVYTLRLNNGQFCEIPVFLTFDIRYNQVDYPKKEYPIGWFGFSWVASYSPAGLTTPSIEIHVLDMPKAENRIAKLFSEIKTGGGAGINVSWSSILENVFGYDAETVFGDWDSGKCEYSWEHNLEYDDTGRRITELPAGQHAFSLQSLKFEATL